MLRSILSGVALIVGMSHAFADLNPFLKESTTHLFEGQRFLTLAGTRVFKSSDPTSEIIGDVPRWHLVYASKSTKPGWMQIHGAGIYYYPEFIYEYSAGENVVRAMDNTFIFNKYKNINKESFRSENGFIMESTVTSMEQPLRLPKPLLVDQLKIDSTWGDVGLPEKRFTIRNPSKAPYSAVVSLIRKSRGGSGEAHCTGFFIESKELIATSSHCLSDDPSNDRFQVNFFDKDDVLSQLSARVVHHKYSVKKLGLGSTTWIDWAILKIDGGPYPFITPLNLLSPGDWQKYGRLEVLVVGHPGDLVSVTLKQFGQLLPALSLCEIPTPQILLKHEGDGSRSIEVNSRKTDCILAKGNSGGPLIIWNSTSQRYEVLGIASYGRYEDAKTKNWSPEAAILYNKKIAQLASEYQNFQGNFRQNLYDEEVPGSRMLLNYVYASEDKNFWQLNDEFVSKLNAPSSTDKNLFDRFEKNSFAMMNDSRQDRRTRFLGSRYIQGYREKYAKLQLSENFLAKRFRQIQTYGEILPINNLKNKGVPLLIVAVETNRDEFILEKDLPEIIKDYKASLTTSDNAVAGYVAKRLADLNDFRGVIIGGDFFVIDIATEKVVEVVRNWLQ